MEITFLQTESNKLVLGEEQIQALELIKEFVNNKEKQVFSLIGAAGTGKSFLMKEVIEYLNNIYKNYCLCAPTHKAKLVLSRFTKSEAVTLHQLLALSPNIEILNLDFNDLKFKIDDNRLTGIPSNGVIICDESSMISDDLFKILLDKAKKFKAKVIFVGDKCQLRPVNALTTSKVFEVPDKYELTKIYRQADDNALMPILGTLRDTPLNHFTSCEKESGSLYTYNNIIDFMTEAKSGIYKAIKSGDILQSKILTYTNASVQAYNQAIRKILFKDTEEYHKFEFLTSYENCEYGMYKFWNSMDYIITDDPVKVDINLPEFIKLPGYKLNLYDSAINSILDVFILSKEINSDYTTALAHKIETLRLTAVEAKERGNFGKASIYWQKYYKLIKSFTTPKDLYYDDRLIRKKSFDFGYAMSSHKSQGSSIDNVYIDMKNISLCRDIDEYRQLQYVALSRTRKNAFILQ